MKSPLQELGGGLSETLDGLGIGYFATDDEGRFVHLNVAAAKILGSPAEDLLNQVTVQQVSADPDFWPNLLHATENGTSVHAIVAPVRGTDDREFWAEWSIRPRASAEEAFRGYEGVFRDVTLQVEDSRKQQRLLEQLSETNAHLSTFSRVQEELLSTLGHDLKTPPGIVLGFCELLLRGRYGEVRPEQTRALHAIHRNTAQLAEMLELLLDFSRFLKRTQVLSVAPYPLESIVRAQLSGYRNANRQNQPRFQLASETDLAVIVAPPDVVSYLLHYLMEYIDILLHPEEVCSVSVSHTGHKTRLVFSVPRQQEERPPVNRLLGNIFVQLPPQQEGDGERRPYRLGPAAVRYLAMMVGAKLSAAPIGEAGVELILTFPAIPNPQISSRS